MMCYYMHMDILDISRNYECFCGNEIAFDYASSYILEHTSVTNPSDLKIAILSDAFVSGFYYNKFENQFIRRGLKPILISCDCTDQNKSLKGVNEVLSYLSEFGFGSNDWLILLGGGGIIDVGCFVKNIFNGGINLMLVPTTLNAIISSSLSYESHINVKSYIDRVVGGFNPNVIIEDPTFLKTNTDKIKKNGMASVIRYALLDNINLIKSLPEPKEMRLFISDIYNSRQRIEKKDIRLLTLGEELRLAIGSYFRFMNYSEGEALALSLLASVDESRYYPLCQIYSELGLPIKLTGVSSKMIIKTLSDNLLRLGNKPSPFVSLENGNWVSRNLEPKDIIERSIERLKVIIDEKE